ncbi:hypothetical protein CVT25_006272 [Psilocybe cyanescens]|uniref:Uncharacterized protein n=1 Tax=Psilocybe cyanescens TaxID=93625 RepID=A0A409WYV4_PSICY|nr:hypothetical protein CVT25_006272 [Psilocybe cyanescens]
MEQTRPNGQPRPTHQETVTPPVPRDLQPRDTYTMMACRRQATDGRRAAKFTKRMMEDGHGRKVRDTSD